MKYLIFFMCLFLSGCATQTHSYYEAAKAISKDVTMSQTACWAAVSDIAKNGNDSVKINAIALAEKCKNEGVKLSAPKNWLGF
jgi:uncharacterized lipoprotein YajG